MKFETFTNGSLFGRQHNQRPKAALARCGRTYSPSGWGAYDRATDYVSATARTINRPRRKLLTRCACSPTSRENRRCCLQGSDGASDGNQRERRFASEQAHRFGYRSSECKPRPPKRPENLMKTRLFALSLAVSLATVAGVASAKGCIEGAAVGGVAGHVAGHHGVAGAAIGCAVGHHRAKVKAKQEAAQTNAAATSGSPASQRALPAPVPSNNATPTNK